jgi:hypothetical protein
LPTIKVTFGGYWLEIKPEDYIANYGNDNCNLAFIGTNESFWTFGMPGMRGYYVTHDIDGDKLGFAPLKGGNKMKLVQNTSTNTTPDALTVELLVQNTSTNTRPRVQLEFWETIAIVAAVVVFIAIITGVIVWQVPVSDADYEKCIWEKENDIWYGNCRKETQITQLVQHLLRNLNLEELAQTYMQRLL